MNILTPARIGPVEVKNRIVMPPMTTRTAADEGFITEDSIAYYMARAVAPASSPSRWPRLKKRDGTAAAKSGSTTGSSPA